MNSGVYGCGIPGLWPNCRGIITEPKKLKHVAVYLVIQHDNIEVIRKIIGMG